MYLLGLKVTVVTDCAAVRCTINKPDLVPRVSRWVMELEEFDYEIKHRPGSQMKHVDALSRCALLVQNKVTDTIKECQQKDDYLQTITKVLELQPYKDFVMQGGVLMKCVNGKNVVVVPSGMAKDIIQRVHDNGHFAVKKMSEIICQDYYIPKLTEKLEQISKNCVQCILADRKRGKREGERPIPKEDTPLLTYHMDHIGPMAETGKKYKYLFIVIDAFSKFTWIYPTKSTNSKEVLDKLVIQQKVFGNPRRIITDKGSAFTSNEFRKYCEEEMIEHVLVTTGVPRGNGQVERINAVIISVLTKLSEDKPEKWYQHVERLQKTINSSFQRSVGCSPFELMVGVKMRQKVDVSILEILEEKCKIFFVDERNELRRKAKESIDQCQEQQKRTYDRKCKLSHKYSVGDLVAMKRTQFGTGLKLKGKFLGPYKIMKKIGVDRYEIKKIGSGEGPSMTTSSADHLKNWRSSGADE